MTRPDKYRRQRIISHLQAAAWWWEQAGQLRQVVELRPAGRSKLCKVADEAARNAHRSTVAAWREAAA